MARKSAKVITGRRARQQERRLAAVKFFEAGKNPSQVARELKVSRQAANIWHHSWQSKGRDGLLATRKPGPDPKFNSTHKEKLKELLLQGAKAHGFETELWTLPRIARVIDEKLGLKAGISEVWRLLRSMGWSPQKPLKRARERKEDKITEWKKEKWPEILKRAHREKRTIVFVDESGLSMRPARKSTWAPEGKTPILEFNFNWKKLSCIGGISLRQIYFQIHDGSVKAPQVVEFVKYLCRAIRGDILIVWDGLRAHWSRAVKGHLETLGQRVAVEQLPAYAPELNPVEYLWAQVKHHEIANFAPKEIGELSTAALKAIRKIRRAPNYIRAFWIQSELVFE
ncbi:MAG: IS630 family transposase [Spartobacteria bacterium]